MNSKTLKNIKIIKESKKDEDKKSQKQETLVHTERWRSKVWGQTTEVIFLDSMKFAIALAALLGVGTAPALAGDFYTNVEYNGSNTGSNFTGSTTDIHLGYEGDLGKDNLGYYIQGGPAVINSEADKLY